MKCKWGWWDLNPCLSSQNSFQLCYPHTLKGDDENFTLFYNNKEQGGSGFDALHDVLLWGTLKSTPTLFFVIETL